MKKEFLVFKLLLFLSLWWGQLSNAHPVAFRGSKGIMGFHSPKFSHNQINYSLRHWVGFGIHYFNRPNLKENKSATILSSNFLLKRWNHSLFQSNIYSVLGGGHSNFSGEGESVGFGLLQFDIEDRRYYFLAKHSQMINEDQRDLKQSTLRIGLAPYLEEYDGIHSWLILEYQNTEINEESAMEDLTPILRIFYRNLLFEIGQSFDGETKFNYIAHF